MKHMMRCLSLTALVILSVAYLIGCGATRTPMFSTARKAVLPQLVDGWKSVTLVPFEDQWPNALPRWADIGDYVYSQAFQSSFDSTRSGTVTVAYSPTAVNGTFVCQVQAQGLKPNFCYQLKLVGKPGISGSGLWGNTTEANMETNARIVRAGRYWNYDTESEAFNTTDRETIIANDPSYAAGWVAGYIYIGCFVTDKDGNTPGFVNLVGDQGAAAHYSYHVTWKSGQSIPANPYGPFRFTLTRSGSVSQAYPRKVSGTNVWLRYEKEPGVAQPYKLPSGEYDVVLMLTEESFHSGMGGTLPSSTGGFWKTVRVSDWNPEAISPVTGCPWISTRNSGAERRVVFNVP